MNYLLFSLFFLTFMAHAGVKSLTPDLEDVMGGKETIYQVSLSSAPVKEVIILIHGIELINLESEWRESLSFIRQQNKVAYFIKWSKRTSLNENVEMVSTHFKKLNSLYPEAQLKVFAHSAGGAVALLALDKLLEEKTNIDLFVHTMSSPLFGYGAPASGFRTMIGSQFVGKATIEIGQGVISRLKNKNLPSCRHYITTNCQLDKHACMRNKEGMGFYPQKGNERVSELPCGEENTTYFDDETHITIIPRVIKAIIQSASN